MAQAQLTLEQLISPLKADGCRCKHASICGELICQYKVHLSSSLLQGQTNSWSHGVPDVKLQVLISWDDLRSSEGQWWRLDPSGIAHFKATNKLQIVDACRVCLHLPHTSANWLLVVLVLLPSTFLLLTEGSYFFVAWKQQMYDVQLNRSDPYLVSIVTRWTVLLRQGNPPLQVLSMLVLGHRYGGWIRVVTIRVGWHPHSHLEAQFRQYNGTWADSHSTTVHKAEFRVPAWGGIHSCS